MPIENAQQPHAIAGVIADAAGAAPFVAGVEGVDPRLAEQRRDFGDFAAIGVGCTIEPTPRYRIHRGQDRRCQHSPRLPEEVAHVRLPATREIGRPAVADINDRYLGRPDAGHSAFALVSEYSLIIWSRTD